MTKIPSTFIYFEHPGYMFDVRMLVKFLVFKINLTGYLPFYVFIFVKRMRGSIIYYKIKPKGEQLSFNFATEILEFKDFFGVFGISVIYRIFEIFLEFFSIFEKFSEFLEFRNNIFC